MRGVGGLASIAIVVAPVAAALAPVAARATLGRALDSVEQDRVHINARAVGSAAAPGYRVQSLTQANGAVVREYAGADGIVFAVAWRGPGRADLRQLLGDGFPVMQASRATVPPVSRRAALAVTRADLVVRSLGHPGGFFGYAYLPDRLPAGFALDALR